MVLRSISYIFPSKTNSFLFTRIFENSDNVKTKSFLDSEDMCSIFFDMSIFQIDNFTNEKKSEPPLCSAITTAKATHPICFTSFQIE